MAWGCMFHCSCSFLHLSWSLTSICSPQTPHFKCIDVLHNFLRHSLLFSIHLFIILVSWSLIWKLGLIVCAVRSRRDLMLILDHWEFVCLTRGWVADSWLFSTWWSSIVLIVAVCLCRAFVHSSQASEIKLWNHLSWLFPSRSMDVVFLVLAFVWPVVLDS